jgi:signal transduction histidine kinase
VIGASKVARDITDKVRAREELERVVAERTRSLREAIAQMEEFSYSVSHDLRSPVRAMRGYAKALAEDYRSRLDEEALDYLDRIIQGSSRMERLIHDVLTYSRVSRMEMRLQPVSLGDLVRDVVAQYPELDSSRSEITIQPGLPGVVGHEPSLGQALANLLTNAVKFVAPGTKPRVHISAEQKESCVRVRIRDNGIGVKPEHQARLFGMFQRVHPDDKYEGTGIGLAMVRKTLERMGGKVGVQSDGVNGSTFWFELPGVNAPGPE